MSILTTSAIPAGCSDSGAPDFGYKLVATYPHDCAAFTQGLAFDGGYIYEGTGRYGLSTIRRIDLTRGEVLEHRSLSPDLFGEGITIIKDRIFQVTWTSGIAIVYRKSDLVPLERFAYQSEGWGLTDNDSELIMSDGTNHLYFFDPDSWEQIRTVSVRDGDSPVYQLNELEYCDGLIFANVFQTDRIAMIDPRSGQVKGWLDLSGIPGTELKESNQEAVLNGIAWDSRERRLFVTGKLWPWLHQIELVPPIPTRSPAPG